MNSFGRLFRVSIFGESHGKTIGVVMDGCPAGIPLSVDDFSADLSRRKPGAKGTTARHEADMPEINSGIFKGKTSGAPIVIQFSNKDVISKDYEKLTATPRPGHADFVAMKKFGGYADLTGGGHFSGRLTLALVAAGVIAKKMIDPIQISAEIVEAGGSKDIEEAVAQAVENQDSIGGIVECQATNMPLGLGEPFFDSVESIISHIVFAIPAIKGIEFGSGFKAAVMVGSQHNDAIVDVSGKTASNHAGGINGGISNGNPLVFRVAVKPTSSIGKTQQTINLKNEQVGELKIEGRHDACIALRVPVVIEAATAIALADLCLIDQQQKRIIHQ
ncbi:MAG: chorismate synthase [Bacteroidales bacterium]|nr:chorismate synthase [Bacteroidales bacterium]MCF8457361.1 chorismate synthase [Bacteroidales bacterium]